MNPTKHTLLSASFLLGAFLSTSQADLVLKQKLTSAVGQQEITMTIKGDLVRSDVGKDASTIMNTATGDMTTLMHAQKMAITTKGADLKAAQDALKKEGSKAAEVPKPVATGTMEKVGEYDCEIYTMESSGVKTKMWIAKSYPNWEAIKKELGGLSKMSAGQGISPDLMPGMALKTETEAGGIKSTTILVSCSTDLVDDAVLKTPEGYKAP